MTFLKNFINDEQGQDMVEYTLILAFVALAIGALYSTMGNNILAIWQKTCTALINANAAAQ